MSKPYEMSIEYEHGKSDRYGYHLGTHEAIARSLIEERFAGRVAAGLPTVTIALIQDGKLIDTFYGDKWHSQLVSA